MLNHRYVFLLGMALAGCSSDDAALAELPLQHVGIASSSLGSTSGVPPLGEGVPPVVGHEGDGAAVVTQVGNWSGGPGAVKWHGGQWVMPYQASPGTMLQNVSCDVWNPTTAAPANVLIEVVSSNGQVLGSTTLPASTSVVFRAWPFVGSHAVIDGEQIAVRLSPRDATTGTWTSAAQDVTVIGCAVNATWARTQVTIPPALFASPTADWQVSSSPHSMFTRSTVGSDLVGGFPVRAGETLNSVTLPVSGVGHLKITAKLLSQGMATQLLGTSAIDVTDPSVWVPLTLNLQDTLIGPGVGLDLAVTGTATTTWGVDVGIIALTYTPAM